MMNYVVFVEIFVMSVISEGGQVSMGQATPMMDTSYS